MSPRTPSCLILAFATALLASNAASAPTASGMCEEIGGDLPSECNCVDTKGGFRLQCKVCDENA